MKTILITGGAGFIGSRLTARLVSNGYDVRVFDNLHRGEMSNLSPIEPDSNLEFVQGDIRDRDAVSGAVVGVDCVVHLAAVCLNRSIEYPSESLEVNLIGANNVFRAASEEGVAKILAASSASVYGNQSIPMSETDSVAPKTPYGTSKRANEQLLQFYADQYDIDYLAYRFFNVFGPGQHTDAYYTSVINVFIKSLLRGDAPKIHGSGDQTMDFVHVEDVARALQLGLETETPNGVVNVGSGEMTSISELAELLIEVTGADITPDYQPRDVLVSERKADTERAKEWLGFSTMISVQDGLRSVTESKIEGGLSFGA